MFQASVIARVVCVLASHQFSATALYCASRNGHLQVVHLLLARGSVECKDEVRQSIIYSVTLSIVVKSSPAVTLHVHVHVFTIASLTLSKPHVHVSP